MAGVSLLQIWPKTPPRVRSILLAALIAAGIFLPRLWQLDAFFIQDEHLWINRAQLYSTALQHNDLVAASAFELQNHPAITLLSTVGPTMQLYAWQHELPGTYESWPLNNRREAAAWARLVLGLVASCALFALYRLLSKLKFFAGIPWAAGGIAILLGLEPWIWGITRTVIVDTLMAIFLVLSLVTGALARERRDMRFVALAGAWWALAFLSKSPSLIILPIALLLPTVLHPREWKFMLQRLVVWVGGAYLTLITVWPPFLLHPVTRFRGVFARVEYHTALEETYLWPGWHVPFFMYILSGFAVIGCVLYAWLRWRACRRDRSQLLAFDILLISGVWFGAVLLYLHGDHARKNVPVLALLATAGAAGWILLLRRYRCLRPWGVLGLVALQFVLVYPWFPHLPSYHNVLFPSREGKRLLVDVGNGSRLIANYVNWHHEPIIAATNLPGLAAFYVREDRRKNLRRLPAQLRDLAPDVTHIIVPESYPARINFDPAAVSLLHDLEGKQPETVLSVRDVPLFKVYRVK